MSSEQGSSEQIDKYGEEARWRDECSFRERELALREREIASTEGQAARWWSPLVVAILVAALAAAGNAYVAWQNGNRQRGIETQRLHHALVLQMLHASDANQAAENISFLLQTGLLQDSEMADRLKTFLSTRQPNSGPLIVGPVPVQEMSYHSDEDPPTPQDRIRAAGELGRPRAKH